MTETEDHPHLKMSELTEGMVITYYGMELLLTDRHERQLNPAVRHDADVAEGLEAADIPPMVYWFTGLIQNIEEVDARGVVPRGWRHDGKWTVQGNDLVSRRVIKFPEEGK